MAEEVAKKDSERSEADDVQALPQKETQGSPASKEKRPWRSSMRKNTSDDNSANAQTPAQKEAAKESQMHEVFHDTSTGAPSDVPNDAGMSKEISGGQADRQTSNRNRSSISSEDIRAELKKAAREEALFPGDELIPDAVMVYDQKRTIRAPAEDIFPWLLQMGKNRGGWYLPLRLEAILPFTWRPSRTIEPRWQKLTLGERIADYGFGRNDYFVVERVEEPYTIVLRSKRYGCEFTWALLLRELHDHASDPEPATVVHVRFRGQLKAEGFRRRVVVKSGQVLDKVSMMPMLAGLAERCEQRGELEKEKEKEKDKSFEKTQRRSFAGLRRFSRSAPDAASNPRHSVA